MDYQPQLVSRWSLSHRMIVAIIGAMFLAAACERGAEPPEDAGIDSGDASTLDAHDDADIPDGGAMAVPTHDVPSPRTSALYARLVAQVEANGVLFGQQYASWEGHGGRLDGFGSDVRDALALAVGERAEHPAVFGWNFETWMNGNEATRAAFRQRLIETDAAGGINTIHWPMGNFCMDCGERRCTDNDNVEDLDPVAYIAANTPVLDELDGTTRGAGDALDVRADLLAAFLKTLVDADGALIPIIVRPFHEMNNESPGLTAHWWTGRDYTAYRRMFQRFVDRLRVTNQVTSALYAFAPRGELLDGGEDTPLALYARYWPETDPSTVAGRYVDIAAFDAYLKDSHPAEPLFAAIRTTYDFAHAEARVIPRVTAVAEVGRKDGTGAPHEGGGTDYQNGPFWTERILPGMDANDGALWRKTAFMMTWTNGTYTTYVGAPEAQAADFVAFFDHSRTLFLDDVARF